MFGATQDAIRKLLEHADRLEWSLQGFGMLRAYLGADKRTRLHIWDDRYAVPNVSTIHDHPWHFESLVVSGQVENTIYEEQAPVGATHHVQRIICGPGGCAMDRLPDVRLYVVSSRVYRAEQVYGQRAHWVHESKPSRGAVTLVHRKFLDQTEQAHVLFPVGAEWVSAEPRPATREEVASIVGYALSVWGSQ